MANRQQAAHDVPFRYSTDENAMQTTTARAIYEYWTRVKGGRDVPNRRDIDPAELRHHLPDLFILEQSAGTVATFRLAGTRLCTLFGREMRGADFREMFAANMQARASRACATALSRREPATLQASAYGTSLEAVPVEILLLPMTSHTSRADRIFGAAVPLRPVQHLDVPFRYMTLESVEMTHEQVTALPAAEAAPSPSLVAVSRSDIGCTMRRIFHLRVFDGGR